MWVWRRQLLLWSSLETVAMAKRGTASISSPSFASQGLVKHVLQRKAGIYPAYTKPTATLLQIFAYRNQNQNYVLMLLEILNKTPKNQNQKPKTFRNNCWEFCLYLFVWWWSVPNRQCILLNHSIKSDQTKNQNPCISLPTPTHGKTLICHAGNKTKKTPDQNIPITASALLRLC